MKWKEKENQIQKKEVTIMDQKLDKLADYILSLLLASSDTTTTNNEDAA